MRCRDYSFQWNLDGVKESDLKKVRIEISSDYHWGSGWTSLEAKDRFEDEVYFALTEAGYSIVRSYKDGVCPTLRSFKDLKVNLYLHPMEFTGYLSGNDTDTVMKLLKEKCHNTVYDASLSFPGDKDKAPTYDLDDIGYDEVLEKNINGILQFIIEAKENGVTGSDTGFEFARHFRLDYPEQSCIYSSMDRDVSFVNRVNDFIRESGISAEEYLKHGNILSAIREKQEAEEREDPCLE